VSRFVSSILATAEEDPAERVTEVSVTAGVYHGVQCRVDVANPEQRGYHAVRRVLALWTQRPGEVPGTERRKAYQKRKLPSEDMEIWTTGTRWRDGRHGSFNRKWERVQDMEVLSKKRRKPFKPNENGTVTIRGHGDMDSC